MEPSTLHEEPYGLDVTLADLAEVFALYSTIPTLNAVFSCNAHGDTWPKHNIGWTDHHDRNRVEGASVLLDVVVELSLDLAPEGGVLDIDLNGVRLRRSGQALILFNLADNANSDH